MKKIATAILALSATTAFAAPLTPEQALDRMNEGNLMPLKKASVLKTDLVYTSMTKNGTPAAFIFNNAGGGYFVLAGDDVAFPVLGYSKNGSIDSNNISPELKWWLSEYASEIEFASAKGARKASASTARASQQMDAIAPLCKTKWDQSAPYNLQCPEYQGRQCVTGCVATSMAQLMKYHNYPEIGEGKTRYTCDGIGGQRLTIFFDREAFDWKNMLDYYQTGAYNETESAAVAYLMKACGYSVNMNYTPDVSGATGESIANALRTYFKYDKDCRSYKRMLYSWDEWNNMIYDNLKNVGPLVLNGQSPLDGGHSFIVDGYDGNGYYHLNWGWGGLSDGYYALSALNPDAQGIGGYVGGFNFSQNAILGAKPDDGGEAPVVHESLLQNGRLTATISGKNLQFNVGDYNASGWSNACDTDIEVHVGVIITKENDAAFAPLYVQGKFGNNTTVMMPSGVYYPKTNPSVVLPDLADGTYKVTVACKNIKATEWTPVPAPYGYPNYVYVTVNNGDYTVAQAAIAEIEYSNVKILTDIFYGKWFKMSVDVANKSDLQLVSGLSPVLILNGKNVMMGESVVVIADPNESSTKEMVTKFILLQGGRVPTTDTEYTLGLYNPVTGAVVGTFGTVTMKPNPGNYNLSFMGASIEGAVKEDQVVNGVSYYSVNMIPDVNNFKANMSYKVNSGFFDGRIVVDIATQNPENPNQHVVVVDDIYNSQPFLTSGESQDINLNVNFPEGETGKIYFLELKRIGNTEATVGSIRFMAQTSGVDEIEGEDNCEPEYYNLQGVRIQNPTDGELVIERRGRNVVKKLFGK